MEEVSQDYVKWLSTIVWGDDSSEIETIGIEDLYDGILFIGCWECKERYSTIYESEFGYEAKDELVGLL